MYSDVIYSIAIGLVGAILFLLVDKHEPDGPMARLLKFLVLFVASVPPTTRNCENYQVKTAVKHN